MHQPQSKSPRPSARTNQRPASPPPRSPWKRFLRQTWHRLGSWRKLFHIPTFRLEPEKFLKAAVCGALVILFSLLQTTIFARFRPFGAIPDLMLPLVIAIAMREGERWGAVWGLIAAFVIESLGAGGVSLLPLLYGAAGYFCPIITELHLSDTIPVRLIYTAVSGVGRALITLIYLAIYVHDFHLVELVSGVIAPEYASTFVMAFLPHLAVRLCLRPFHKTRAERVTTL